MYWPDLTPWGIETLRNPTNWSQTLCQTLPLGELKRILRLDRTTLPRRLWPDLTPWGIETKLAVLVAKLATARPYPLGN